MSDTLGQTRSVPHDYTHFNFTSLSCVGTAVLYYSVANYDALFMLFQTIAVAIRVFSLSNIQYTSTEGTTASDIQGYKLLTCAPKMLIPRLSSCRVNEKSEGIPKYSEAFRFHHDEIPARLFRSGFAWSALNQ